MLIFATHFGRKTKDIYIYMCRMYAQVRNYDRIIPQVIRGTPSKTNSSPLKHDGWKTTFLLGR